MLQTLKSTIVLGTLLVVGYGVHVMLNRPTDGSSDAVWNDAADVDLPDIDFGEDSLERPSTSLAAEAASDTPSPAGPDEAVPLSSISSVDSVHGERSTDAPEQAWAPPDAVDSPSPYSDQAMATTDLPPEGILPEQQVAPHGTNPPRVTISNVSHVASSFDSTWFAAQDKLLNGQLVEALLSLSFLYANDQLGDSQRDQLIERLDQLAGSVIYSPAHLMERPYVVQGGESWEQIAGPYQVPAMFLARVNGLSIESPPPAGTTLKVVRGPFRGELSLGRRELTLFLGRHYAGRFNVGIGRDLPAHVTALEVVEKTAARPYTDVRTGEMIPPGSPDNPYGSLWIGLRDLQSASDLPLGIHSTGAAIGASDTRGCITVSDRDADDLQAILSIGSRVEIRR